MLPLILVILVNLAARLGRTVLQSWKFACFARNRIKRSSSFFSDTVIHILIRFKNDKKVRVINGSYLLH